LIVKIEAFQKRLIIIWDGIKYFWMKKELGLMKLGYQEIFALAS